MAALKTVAIDEVSKLLDATTDATQVQSGNVDGTEVLPFLLPPAYSSVHWSNVDKVVLWCKTLNELHLFLSKFVGYASNVRLATYVCSAMKWSNHKNAHCMQLCNMQQYSAHYTRSADQTVHKEGQEA